MDGKKHTNTQFYKKGLSFAVAIWIEIVALRDIVPILIY